MIDKFITFLNADDQYSLLRKDDISYTYIKKANIQESITPKLDFKDNRDIIRVVSDSDRFTHYVVFILKNRKTVSTSVLTKESCFDIINQATTAENYENMDEK